MAIGDAAPDLEMMRVAGVSVAMGNAPDDVKSQVDAVGPSNQDDGVAWAIRRYAS
jgi:hydroxymethylpyrimidine pyrophosphatase-like HAD family hydrolase